MIFLWNHHWFPSLKYPLIITICRSVNNYFNEFFASFLFLIFGIQFFKYVLLSTIRFLHLSLSLSLVFSFVSFSYVCSFLSFHLPVFFSVFFLPHTFSLFCLPSFSPSSPNLDQFLSPLICLAHFLCLSLSSSVLLYFSLTSSAYRFSVCLVPFLSFSTSLYLFLHLSISFHSLCIHVSFSLLVQLLSSTSFHFLFSDILTKALCLSSLPCLFSTLSPLLIPP